MFKSKWQKKYEKAMESIEFWKNFYEEQSKKCQDNQHLVEIYSAQKIALGDTLRDMKRIAEP